MTKYRRLSLEELEILKEDFIKFLIAHGIDSHEWQRLNSVSVPEAEKLIHLFSDFVLEMTLTKITYIDHFDGLSMRCFKCDEEKIFLACIESSHKFDTWESMKTHITTQPHLFRVYQADKLYKIERNLEIFGMLNTGAQISSADNYESIKRLTMNSLQ